MNVAKIPDYKISEKYWIRYFCNNWITQINKISLLYWFLLLVIFSVIFFYFLLKWYFYFCIILVFMNVWIPKNFNRKISYYRLCSMHIILVHILFVCSFLLPLSYYLKVMEASFSVKISNVEFSPNLYILRSPESKKMVFGNWSVRMYACVCAYACVCPYACVFVCVWL